MDSNIPTVLPQKATAISIITATAPTLVDDYDEQPRKSVPPSTLLARSLLILIRNAISAQGLYYIRVQSELCIIELHCLVYREDSQSAS